MAAAVSYPKLCVVRLPGEEGPILRCSGELTLATEEILRRELDLVLPIGHPVLTLNLSDCHFVDVDGILTLLHTYQELRRNHSRLAIVTGIGRVARLLHCMGIERVIPLYLTEGMAAQAPHRAERPEAALLGDWPRAGAPAGTPEGGHPRSGSRDRSPGDAPAWETAREQTIARWRTIQALIAHGLLEEAQRPLIAMTALCVCSEALSQHHLAPATLRCQFCPLFYELGGRGTDVGCRSVQDPILEAVRAGDADLAWAQADEMIRILEELAVPEPAAAPLPGLPAAFGDPVVQ